MTENPQGQLSIQKVYSLEFDYGARNVLVGSTAAIGSGVLEKDHGV